MNTDNINDEANNYLWDLGSKVLLTQDLDLLLEFKSRISNLTDKELDDLKISRFIKNINDLEKELQAKPKRKSKTKDTLKTVGLGNGIIPNNKLSNIMTNENIFNKPIELITLSGKAKDITTSCLVEYNKDLLMFETSKPFTEYDRAVYNAIVSHYIAGNLVVTADMICRAMSGKLKGNPSEIQVNAIKNSIEKMSMLRVSLDLTDELKKRKVSLDDEFITSYKVKTSLLLGSYVSITTKSKEIEAFCIKEPPILYSYSHVINQVITIPIEVLNIPIRDTEQLIQLKNYLIRRIEGMKADNKLKQNSVLLESIYELLDISTKQECNRIRNNLTKILNYWVEIDYIKRYEFIKKSNIVHSIKFSF